MGPRQRRCCLASERGCVWCKSLAGATVLRKIWPGRKAWQANRLCRQPDLRHHHGNGRGQVIPPHETQVLLLMFQFLLAHVPWWSADAEAEQWGAKHQTKHEKHKPPLHSRRSMFNRPMKTETSRRAPQTGVYGYVGQQH